MTPTLLGKRGTKTLSSSSNTASASQGRHNRYELKNAGPQVRDKGKKLVGKSINNVARQTDRPMTVAGRPAIESNVLSSKKDTSQDPTVSDITCAADQFNSYRFDESAAMKTYKKMMTLHLKDEMFGKMKFITNESEMEFSRRRATLCGYVCTGMRVPDYQWGEYWDLVKHTTKKMIEQQRTNATSAIKKGFRGK